MIVSLFRILAALVALLVAGIAQAAPSEGATETVEQALCRLIEGSAKARGLPVPFLTRLIWRESSFRAGVTSAKGAQGIAQFMPGTASERKLSDPFDPEQAIPAAAALIADLGARFGSIGLAAAAYNAGPTRVKDFLAGSGSLPSETRDYVAFVTGHPVEDWTSGLAEAAGVMAAAAEGDCLTTVAAIRATAPDDSPLGRASLPWGVHLTGGLGRDSQLAAYGRIQQRFAGVIGGYQPTLLPVRIGGARPKKWYQVRIAFADRRSATRLCGKLRAAGGDCLVTRN